MITNVLSKHFYVNNPIYSQLLEGENCDYSYLGYSKYHKDFYRDYNSELQKNFSEKEIAKLLTFQDYQETDLFLYFHSQANNKIWLPFSFYGVGINKVPKYIIQAKNKQYAENLLLALGLNGSDINKLKYLIKEGITELDQSTQNHQLYSMFFNIFNIDEIGTE